MPETGIGFFPDIGGSVFLGRLPPGIGTYLGITGARLDAGEALHLGLIDKVVDPDQFDILIEVLASGVSAEEAVAVAQSAPLPAPDISALLTVSRAFDQPSALGIVQALEREQTEAASRIAASLRRRCPFSLEITARLIAVGGRYSLRDALAIDFRIAQRFMERDDYFEGVRAVLVDRDNAPAWVPARLEDVNLKEVEACFAPLAGRELWPLSAEAARDLP
jgi:enoyl-CoA hydratase